MTWQEIYKKYKDTKLIKEFIKWYKNNTGFTHTQTVMGLFEGGEINIKDIWGYLIVFAETKGYDISLWNMGTCNIMWKGDKNWRHIAPKRKRGDSRGYAHSEKTNEQAMLWVSDKFFEIGDK